MSKNKSRILSTMPVNKAMIIEAKKNDIIIDEASFISTEIFVSKQLEKKIKILSNQIITAVFTSKNATEAVGKHISGKPNWEIFCIGNTTKRIAAKIFGEENIMATANNADLLAQRIIKNSHGKKIFFFCGDQRRDELPEKLERNGTGFKEIIVYKTKETPCMITKKYAGILFYSPSAVKSFFSVNKINDSTKIFAIGNTTAGEIKNYTKIPVIISDFPDKENLIKLAIGYFTKINTN
jgi:uroporphyrinogen-III synthase